MELHAVKTPIIRPGDDLVSILLEAISDRGFTLLEYDVLVIAETVVATVQGRIVDLNTVGEVSPRARALATEYEMDPRLVELVVREADEVVGGVKGVLLALIHGLLIANAGIDASNSGGDDLVVLLPEHPVATTRAIQRDLQARTGKHLGVVLADSRVQPLKRGVSGVAITTAGFEPIEDCRGRVDLFGRPLRITFRAAADDLASAAQLLLGEADEQTPVVLVRDAPLTFTNSPTWESMAITPKECLYINALKARFAGQAGEK